MTIAQNPYATALAGREAVASLTETSARLNALLDRWDDEVFARPWAPGKWTAGQILLHLLHIELMISTRVRLALVSDGYVAQPFEQDEWMAQESGTPPRAVAMALRGLREVNLHLFGGLTPEQRARACSHPERGAINVNWFLEMLAGHDQHHLPQLEGIQVPAA